jgi:hypothetical protein
VRNWWNSNLISPQILFSSETYAQENQILLMFGLTISANPHSQSDSPFRRCLLFPLFPTAIQLQARILRLKRKLDILAKLRKLSKILYGSGVLVMKSKFRWFEVHHHTYCPWQHVNRVGPDRESLGLQIHIYLIETFL